MEEGVEEKEEEGLRRKEEGILQVSGSVLSIVYI